MCVYLYIYIYVYVIRSDTAVHALNVFPICESILNQINKRGSFLEAGLVHGKPNRRAALRVAPNPQHVCKKSINGSTQVYMLKPKLYYIKKRKKNSF